MVGWWGGGVGCDGVYRIHGDEEAAGGHQTDLVTEEHEGAHFRGGSA